MKKLYPVLFLLVTLLSFKASAQETVMSEINYTFLEKCIQSAKDHYIRRKIFGLRAQDAHLNISTSTISYLDIFTASYFYRPNDKPVIAGDGLTTANPYSVNGFQFGGTINIGQYLQKPFLVKKAKYEYQIAELEAQEYDKTLATEVKTNYYNYIQQLSQLKLTNQSVQDTKSIAETTRNKFQKGEATLDVYNQSRAAEAAAESTKIQAEIAYLKAKDALEDIIGVKLTEIK
ncbi:TolC family protein [Mucilaginibacter corticis]|uniref:TolC family protein n=1 Tax=Mucilaginibacter corticis TaxID=2597670 RepID=A0A556MLL5_9SPHI|nr:TolC family protein [Mucilaginibacter corticis]TSJ40742.1 TolC family protein [Mucilaginibacter corticis]